MGRRKISIKQIADPKLRHITFNKRRNGLIKKAAELSLLCNVNMLVIFEDGNGNLIQFSRNKLTTIPSFFKDCTYSSVSEFTSKDYPNFFKVNHYKKHNDEENGENEQNLEEVPDEPEDVAPEFDQPAPQIKIINKRENIQTTPRATEEDDYMSDHMVYYAASEASTHEHEGSEGVRTFSESQPREPYYNQSKPSQFIAPKQRLSRPEESQKPVIYEQEISQSYPEEQEVSPSQRESYQLYKEMPSRPIIHEDKIMDYASSYMPYERPVERPIERPIERPSDRPIERLERPERPVKRQSYADRYYPPEHIHPYANYPYPHGYPYTHPSHPYPPHYYPAKHRPRAYYHEEAVNNMFRHAPKGFMEGNDPYMGKPSNRPEMDERVTGTANMIKYLNNSGTNTYAGQKIYNFYSSETNKPEENEPPSNYRNRNDYEGLQYDAEEDYPEFNPYYRPDYRYENGLPTNLPTNLPSAYFSSKKFNFDGYPPNSFEDDRFNEFADPKKKLKQ